MVRKLLATTALAGFLTTGAYAQSTPAQTNQALPPAAADDSAPASAATPAEPSGAAAGGTQAAAAFDYLTTLGSDQHLSDEISGSSLYASSAPDAQEAGEIQDFVVGADGSVIAVVIQTGEALGDDSRQIAVPFDQVEWSMDENNEPRAVLTADVEAVRSAPTFEGESTAAADGTAPSGSATGMAPTTPVPGTEAPAMAADGGTATTAQPSTPATETAQAETPAGSGAEGEYIATLGPEQFLSEDLVGRSVYSGPTTESDNIGEINNLVISSNGMIDAMVIGVGGFLGIGEKDVGVPFDAVELSTTEGEQAHASLAVTREQLEEAPAFEGRQDGAMNTAASGTASPAAGTGAAAGAAAGTAAGVAGAGSEAMPGMAADTSTTASTGGAPDMSQMTPVTGAELTTDNLIGTTVYGPDNQTIGDVGDIAMTPQGEVEAIVVDVGGFLGIGAKPVAVAIDNLQFMRDSSGSMFVMTEFSQEQLEAAPEYDSQTYAQNRDTMLLQSADAAGASQDGGQGAPGTANAPAQ